MHPPSESGSSAPDRQRRRRVALFGGSFDPPHAGHIGIARAAVEDCRLDSILFLPCRISPLKDRTPAAAPSRRMDMLALACADIPGAKACDWELNRPGPSYSWQTAEHFHRLLGPHTDLFWLMGADQWARLGDWQRPDYLASLVTFIVFPRDGVPPAAHPWRHVVLSRRFPGSSTEIRRRIARGQPVSDLLPPAVEQYIREHRLYQNDGIDGENPE